MQKRIDTRSFDRHSGLPYAAQRNSWYGPGASSHRRQCCFTSGQYAPSTSTISAGHAPDSIGAIGASDATGLGVGVDSLVTLVEIDGDDSTPASGHSFDSFGATQAMDVN